MSNLATSSDPDFDLTLEAMLGKKENDNDLSLLFPPLSPTYFKDKPDALVSKDKNIIERYNDSPMKPYIKKRDLSDPFDDHHLEGGNKNAWEIGIKFSF